LEQAENTTAAVTAVNKTLEMFFVIIRGSELIIIILYAKILSFSLVQ
jgi:hypothetical protein